MCVGERERERDLSLPWFQRQIQWGGSSQKGLFKLPLPQQRRLNKNSNKNLSVSADERRLPGQHGVRAPLDGVHDGLLLPVEGVHHRLRHRVVAVDGGEREALEESNGGKNCTYSTHISSIALVAVSHMCTRADDNLVSAPTSGQHGLHENSDRRGMGGGLKN